jgi:hypothetical protein
MAYTEDTLIQQTTGMYRKQESGRDPTMRCPP